jgi:hypothetical protein
MLRPYRPKHISPKLRSHPLEKFIPDRAECDFSEMQLTKIFRKMVKNMEKWEKPCQDLRKLSMFGVKSGQAPTIHCPYIYGVRA